MKGAVKIVVLHDREMIQSDMGRTVLFTFLGNKDPLEIPPAGTDPGPVLSLLRAHSPPMDHVVLLLTGGEYVERAQVIKDVALREGLARTFSYIDIHLNSVVDYEELYEAMSAAVVATMEQVGTESRLSVLLDPGTPQMQTIWFLLAYSRIMPARLLQGIPPRFGNGRYQFREVRLHPERVPLEVRHLDAPHHHGISDPEEITGPVIRWSGREQQIVGASDSMRELLKRVRQVAPYDQLVLITGETGTGKELIARRLHQESPRRDHPFVPVNVATLERQTAASALFGHCKGAYTGADATRLGAFRSADRGTLFLDEIGELTLDLQAQLLRALEIQEIVPLGEDTPIQVDVRVVAATNQNLPRMVREGSFREDLYERLRQFPLSTPPLRERDGDIPRITRYILTQWNRRYDARIALHRETGAILEAYSWPGNVRQLENVLRRSCVIAGPDGTITPELISNILREERSPGPVHNLTASPTPLPPLSEPRNLREILNQVEREHYRAALEQAHGNQAEAARLLGLNPPAFRKALRERFSDLQNH
jgi:DNA-binding NtrC family response regulator